MGRSMTLGLTLPIVAGFGLAVKAAAEEEAAIAQLDQALRKNLGMTRENRAEVEKQITSWQNATGILDDRLRPSLANLLRAGMDWTQAQKTMTTAMDIARARGVDLEVVTKAISRAYMGNTASLGRLNIQTKDANGNMLSFDEIMQKAAETMGGAASRHAKTAAGRMEILKARFADLTENIGAALLPVLEKLGAILGKVAGWFENLSPQMQNIIVYAGLAVAALGPLVYIFGTLATVVGVLLSPITLVILALAAIAAAAYLLWTNWDTIWTWIKEHPAIAVIVTILATPVAAFVTIVGGLKWLYENWDSIWSEIQAVTDAVVGAVTGAWNFMGGVISAVYNGVIAPVLGALGFAIGLVRGAIESLMSVWSAVWSAIGAVIGPIAAGIVGTLSSIVGVIREIISAARTAADVLSKIGDIGGKISNPGGKGEFGGIFGAAGGIVTRPTMAMIGEAGPEAVIPLHSAPGASPLPRGFGGGGQIVIPVMIDGREVARAVWREDDERDRRRGR
jgi:hypothetical protein